MATKKKTVRSAKTDYVLDDARHLSRVARKHVKEFAAADKGKKKVRVSAALLNALDSKINAVGKASAAVASTRTHKEHATASEVKARAPLAEALIEIRDDVATIHDDDKAVRRAFGVGARIDKSSTPILLKLASDILYVVESDKPLAAAAKEAGIDATRIKQLRKAHDALANAQSDQVSAIADSRLDGVDKREFTRAIQKDVTFIHKVAAIVFRKSPKTMKEFASTLPKHKVRARAKAGTPTKAAASSAKPPSA